VHDEEGIVTGWLRRRRLVTLTLAVALGSGCYRNVVRTRDVEEIVERRPAEEPASTVALSTDSADMTVRVAAGRLCGTKLSGRVRHFEDSVPEKTNSSYILPGSLIAAGTITGVIGLSQVQGSCQGQACNNYQPFVGPVTAGIGAAIVGLGLISGLVVLALPGAKQGTTRELSSTPLDRWEDPNAWCPDGAPMPLADAELAVVASYPTAGKSVTWSTAADARGEHRLRLDLPLFAARHCGEGVLEIGCISPPPATRAVLRLPSVFDGPPGPPASEPERRLESIATECAAAQAATEAKADFARTRRDQ
jgi:hypothetical protein